MKNEQAVARSLSFLGRMKERAVLPTSSERREGIFKGASHAGCHPPPRRYEITAEAGILG